MPQHTKKKSNKSLLLGKIARNYYPGVICGIGILILTLLPGFCFSRINPHPQWGLDKVAHALMFLVFGFVTLWGYRKSFASFPQKRKKRIVLTVALIGIVFGIVTEILQQTFANGRHGDIIDGIADTIGTLIGIGIFVIFQEKRNKNQKSSVI